MKIDFHVHTDRSPDSRMSLAAAVKAAKKRGLDGIAVADHNEFSPSPAIDGFLVIPACEYSTDAGHIIAYFIREPLNFGLKTDSKGRYHWRDIAERARAQGAFTVLAHPYSPVFERSDEVFAAIDGIEGYNARIEHSSAKGANLLAAEKIRELSCPFTAGSDAHFPREVGAAYWECDMPCSSCEKIHAALRSGKGRIYGGRAKAIWRPLSSWIKLFSSRDFKGIPKLILRTAKALLKSLAPNKTPVIIDMKGDSN